MAQKGVRSCTTVKISNKLAKCYVKLYTTAATSESSQTCSFYLPAGWSTSGVLALAKRAWAYIPQKGTGIQGQVLAVSSDPRGSVSCLQQCRSSRGQHCGPIQIFRQGQAAGTNLSDLMDEPSQWKRHQILQVEGSKNESSIAHTVQTCSRELYSGKLGLSETANPGQSIHSPEWGSIRRFQLQNEPCGQALLHAGALGNTAGSGPGQRQFHSLQCSLVHGIGRLCYTPQNSHKGSQQKSQGQAGAVKRIQDKKPSKKEIRKGGCALGVGDSLLSWHLSVGLSHLSFKQETKNTHANTGNRKRKSNIMTKSLGYASTPTHPIYGREGTLLQVYQSSKPG